MYTDSILNDYLESSQIDQSQLSDFLIMLEDYKNQLPGQEALFVELFDDESSTINVLPF
jgi:hypothetical protein